MERIRHEKQDVVQKSIFYSQCIDDAGSFYVPVFRYYKKKYNNFDENKYAVSEKMI